MRASAITGRRVLAVCFLTPVAVLVAACGSAGSAGAPRETISVSIAPASLTPSAAASPVSAQPVSAGPSPCATNDLQLTVGEGNGAAGTIYYPLDFTNVSNSACTMYGYPGVAFVSSPGGSQVGAAAGRSSTTGPALVTVAPGAQAHATLAVSDVLIGNNCMDKVQVSFVQVYPPGQYTALFGPLSVQGCADQSLVTLHVDTVTSGS
jgi:hypothetical protein